jgi:hypothetical protein
MAIAALVKFVQGALVGTAGVALVGTLGTNVTASNAVDTGIGRWKWTVVDSPAGSAVPIGVVQDGATPTYTFPADVRGMFHLKLEVYPTSSPTTGPSKTHDLCFCVPERSGRKVPAFDAEAPAMNFSNTDRGWRPIMDSWLRFVDGPAPLVYAGTGSQAGISTKDANGETVKSMRMTGAALVILGLADGYEGRELFVFAEGGSMILGSDSGGEATVTNRLFSSGGDITMQQGDFAHLFYVNSRWRVLVVGTAGAGLAPAGANGDIQLRSGSVLSALHGTAGQFARYVGSAWTAYDLIPTGSTGDVVLLDGIGNLTESGNLNVGASQVTAGIPLIGKSGTPFGQDGTSSQAIVDSGVAQTVSSTNMTTKTLVLTGTLTAIRTLGGFPAPGSSIPSYSKIIDNQANFDVIVSTGTGTTAQVPTGTIRTVLFDTTGARMTSIGSSTGEANTASNVTGSTGVGFFKQKAGVNLEFKSLLPLNSNITIGTSGASDVTVGLVFSGNTNEILRQISTNQLASSTGVTSGTGFIGITTSGAAIGSTGDMRFRNGFGLVARNNANTADKYLCSMTSADIYNIGCDVSATTSTMMGTTRIHATAAIDFGINGTLVGGWGSGGLTVFGTLAVGGAVGGYVSGSAPFHFAEATISVSAGAGVVVTLTAAQYSCPFQDFTGANTAFDVIGPQVAGTPVWVTNRTASAGTLNYRKTAGSGGVAISGFFAQAIAYRFNQAGAHDYLSMSAQVAL